MPITTTERRERFNPGEVLGRVEKGSPFIEGVERAIEAVAALFGNEVVVFSQKNKSGTDGEDQEEKK